MSDYMNIPVRVTDLSVRECVLYANLHLRGEDTDSIGTPLTVKINEEYDRWLEAHDRAVAAVAWDECVKSMRHEEGTPVEVVAVVNPYRQRHRA